MMKGHSYSLTTRWDGHQQETPYTYESYTRAHVIEIDGKSDLKMSADPCFMGDSQRINPEDCLLAALSSCHMLSFLAFAAMRKVKVVSYVDRASGVMVQEDLGGHFTEVTLRPTVTITKESDRSLAIELHEQANRNCFIASSVNFPVKHEVEVHIHS